MAEATAATDQRAVLIVTAQRDNVLARLGDSLSTAGAIVHFATDVYIAMALLATESKFGHVVVESASLDVYERQFLTLAPRYFEKCAFYVTSQSPDDDTPPAGERIEILPAECIVDAILGIRDAETLEAIPDAEGDWAEPRTIGESAPDDTAPQPSDTIHHPHGDALAGPLSTDGPIDPSDRTPSLHDAVRERMGGASPPVRRRPPGAENTDPGPPAPAPNDVRVTREEMDALLGGEHDTLDDMNERTRGGEEDEA